MGKIKSFTTDQSCQDYINNLYKDIFYDLGSWIGKVALQVFLKTSVKKACGIEASDARYRCAEKIYKSVSTTITVLF
ncbi:MAG: hypothetical protein ABSA84_00880 [Gammaproteobacteria bacterium]|jgi:predicted RNA methylase